MATLIKGILSFNLDWQFVLVGVAIAVVMELCGIKALSFAIGIYLPLSTTLPIFIGGAVRGLVDNQKKKESPAKQDEEEDLRKGNLFATGLVAGGAIAGVLVAFLSANDSIAAALKKVNLEESLTHNLGEQGYFVLGTILFFALTFILYRVAMRKEDTLTENQ
jgi:uncharacterized oligopeptide transporter (OPT) family protein